jgi:hypothetical protein
MLALYGTLTFDILDAAIEKKVGDLGAIERYT